MVSKKKSKLCTSIAADSLEEMEQKTELALYFGTDLVEFRIDRLMSRVTPAEIAQKLGKHAPVAVVTVRSGKEGGSFTGSEIERLGLITSLAQMKPAYIDVELSTAVENQRWLGSLPKKVERIVSWHDFKGTPDMATLRAKASDALKQGTIAKVVTTATALEDSLRTLKLCGENPGKVISFCMGQLGTSSRILSMLEQSPIVYASLPNEPVAPGQISIATLIEFRGLMPAA